MWAAISLRKLIPFENANFYSLSLVGNWMVEKRCLPVGNSFWGRFQPADWNSICSCITIDYNLNTGFFHIPSRQSWIICFWNSRAYWIAFYLRINSSIACSSSSSTIQLWFGLFHLVNVYRKQLRTTTIQRNRNH